MTSDLHQRSLAAARKLKGAEADLVFILQEHERTQEFRKRGSTSLHHYCVQFHDLSESVASVFIAVARKAMEVPALQEAIRDRRLNISKIRKITPVITCENQDEWIQKARQLSSYELDLEVVKVAPRESVRERMRPVSVDRFELRLGISKEAAEKFRRVQDLESQRTASAAELEDAFNAMLESYLEKQDPIRKAARAKKRAHAAAASDFQGNVRSNRMPNSSKHEVMLRDSARCTHVDDLGQRCKSERWLEIHHIQHRAQGGGYRAENLRTLCHAHHKMEHCR